MASKYPVVFTVEVGAVRLRCRLDMRRKMQVLDAISAAGSGPMSAAYSVVEACLVGFDEWIGEDGKPVKWPGSASAAIDMIGDPNVVADACQKIWERSKLDEESAKN